MSRFASTSPSVPPETDFRPHVGAGPLPIDAKRHPLVAEVRRRLARYAAVTGSARIVTAVSGGPDSVALLLALLALREQASADVQPWPIIAHINHHLRHDADHDAAFVRALGERFEVPTVVQDIYPGEQGGNLPATAREMRYATLADVARERDAGFLAVAHHAEDQFETMLMALGRGAGVDGLSAMAWSRPLAHDDRSLMLIRPLLGSRKADCTSLCTAAGIQWRDDTSNRDPGRRRNRLRQEVTPVLESCWPNAPARAAMTAELIGQAVLLLDEKLADVFGPAERRRWPRPALAELSPVVIAAGLRRAVHATGDGDASADGTALTQRMLLPAAEAIADDDRSPRTFLLTRHMMLEVRAREVTLRDLP